MKSHSRTAGRAKAIVGVIAAVALTACVVSSSLAAPNSARDATIPTLNIATTAAASTLDFARSNNSAVVQTIESYGMEPLVVIAPDGSIKPHLAQAVKHPSPLRYVYTIRKGVKFWDGNELTATDVANSLNYYRYKGFPTAGQLGYPSVRDITATDRYTVVVNLKKPDASWPVTPATTGWIFEKKFADEHGADMGKPGTLMMGTGPWEFQTFDPTTGLELTANPHYWGGKVNIQHLSIKWITDTTAMALAFRSGALDIAPVNDPQGFAATAGSRSTVFPNCEVLFLGMNTKVAPWSDVHVRRAAAYAINRSDLVTAAGGADAASPVNTLIDPLLLRTVAPQNAIDSLLKNINLYPFDLSKAKAEMAQSGYPNGFTSHLDIFNVGRYPLVAQAIAGDLAPIGINLQVNVMPATTWLAEAAGPHDQIPDLFTGFACTNPDPSQTIQNLLSSKNAVTGKTNRSDYINPTVDTLLAKARQTTDSTKRLNYYGDILKILARDVPYDPLYAPNGALAFSPKFTYPKLNLYAAPPGYPPGRDFLLQIKPK